MNSSATQDLSHISFEGKTPSRRRPSRTRGTCREAFASAPHAPEERLDDFISWALGRAGLDAAAYRPQSLQRRLPACLRAMKVRSTAAARELLEQKPRLVAKAVSSLLIGVTEFFREPDVFDFLRTQALPALAGRNQRLRIWSAACSTGAELYSMAILLSEAGLLARSRLLGSDCRGDAIERAKLGLYDAETLKLVPARRGTSISSRPGNIGGRSKPSAGRSAGRRPTCWPASRMGRGTSFCGGMWPSTSMPVPRKRSGAGWRRFSPRRAC